MKLKRMITIGVMGLGLAAPVAAEDFTGTLAKVAESGVITIGHRESSVPFAYLDENQKPIGYSIDLCMKIVDKVAETVGKDLEIKYVPVNPKTRLALMANGTIDLECGSTTNKLSRQQQVEYLASPLSCLLVPP
ncbi:transporter substrate-binding domain-containing protein [Paracoccaceae bacterium]|nr:transporter substrate-binding domain-containing protein [Paracoccaceae bacterium]